MTSWKKLLLISSVLIFPFMLAIFRVATTTLGAKWGYLLGLATYWTCILTITLILANDQKDYLRKMLRPASNVRYTALLRAAALLPVIGVFFIAFLPHVAQLTWHTALLVVVSAVLNGTIEELYWRGLYLNEFGDSVLIGFGLSTLLFTIWHFAIWYAEGMVFHGGLPALVGGAFAMGVIWSLVARRLHSIRFCIIGHIGVNLCAFTQLYVQNGF